MPLSGEDGSVKNTILKGCLLEAYMKLVELFVPFFEESSPHSLRFTSSHWPEEFDF
jgi:hypothetical protein